MDNEVGRLERIRESLVAVVDEMRANVIHSSRCDIRLPADLARRLDVTSGALVEIAERADPAPSAEALAALGARTGDIVEVRSVRIAPC